MYNRVEVTLSQKGGWYLLPRREADGPCKPMRERRLVIDNVTLRINTWGNPDLRVWVVTFPPNHLVAIVEPLRFSQGVWRDYDMSLPSPLTCVLSVDVSGEGGYVGPGVVWHETQDAVGDVLGFTVNNLNWLLGIHTFKNIMGAFFPL